MNRAVTMQYAFPCAQMLLCLGASVCYAWHGDWRRAAYWLFAAGITTVVTF